MGNCMAPLFALILCVSATLTAGFLPGPIPALVAKAPSRRHAPCAITCAATDGGRVLTRRDGLKLALGGAGLVLGRQYCAGGVWEGTPDLTGRTVIVTGGNTGLGKETCIRLAKLGADIVIASRDAGRGEKAAEQVRTVARGGRVSVIPLDLASLQSVDEFVRAFQLEHTRLDTLVNNAGVMAIPTREVTADGFERQLGINHLGHFHLTKLLMPQLKAAGKITGDARIVNLSSQVGQALLACYCSSLPVSLCCAGGQIAGWLPLSAQVCMSWPKYPGMRYACMHLSAGQSRLTKVHSSIQGHNIAFNGINWDDLQLEHTYDPWKAYGQSKLANVLFSRELARRLANSPASEYVSTCSLHPGVILATELGRNFFVPPQLCDIAGSVNCKGPEALASPLALAASPITVPLMLPFVAGALYTTKSIPQGSMTQVRCAADPELKGKLHGQFFSDCEEASTSGPGRDMVAAERLWKISEELTGPFTV